MGMVDYLQVNNLQKLYYVNNSKIKAVDDVTFNVKAGEVFGLLGPNGAGKTSIIKCICGLLDYDGGDIIVNGYSMKNKRRKGLRHISAVLEGNRNIYWRMTVKENLEFFSGINGISSSKVKERINYLINQFQLQQQKDTVVNKLSRGMKQKVAIAISLIANKDIILLDEPTLGLDVSMSHEMRSILRGIAKDENKTILLSTHDMNVVEATCDRLIIINKGKIIAKDTVDNLKSLFNKEIYKVTLMEGPKNQLKERLKKVAQLLNYQKQAENTSLLLQLDNGNQLIEIFQLFKEEGISLIAIEKVTKNLEGIFIDLLKEEQHEILL
ncbi:ABC transporter ATP-binding protein [Alkaliphilus pronyensis]|uniref:ABC transporter ATP-binding protein n=1 Tax=Alkaliphilus pronyensis TaxID=1482732 RepID=A0A6I0F7I5_9FIRM|nr:ABC transporter ATP-binding protein [Alkaliphilus pronyensis]KAB3534147.1 ABC transporter ATP-binding protein [Alkaliphilus pronyensis]